jgi:1,4-alpha-glucan branching enzyme
MIGAVSPGARRNSQDCGDPIPSKRSGASSAAAAAAIIEGRANRHIDRPVTDTWWQRGVIYQIYPRSFQDANGDGIGDLDGILQRVEYCVSLGIDVLWLSPIYPSPMADFGYDVSDYYHSFLKEQPDLNWRNPDVVSAQRRGGLANETRAKVLL